MTLPESISSRLDRLNEYLTELKVYRQKPLDLFKKDHVLHHATERCLQLAIESVLDIGEHLIAARGYRQPRDYEDVVVVLAENQVIPPELADRLRGVGKFRNLLVHEYVELDLGQVYQQLFELEDIESLAKCLVEAVEKI